MKVTFSVIFCLAMAFAAVLAFPAETVDKDTELIKDDGQQPIVDTGIVGGDGTGFFINPLDNIFQSVDSMVTRMRQQMHQLLNHFQSSNSTDDIGFPGFPSIGDLDLGKGNTTSVTKIINGHKVVVNETTYKKTGENGEAFFNVRIYDVKPDSVESGEGKTILPPTRDTESIESSIENEIPKNKDNEATIPKANIQTLDEVDGAVLSKRQIEGFPEWQEIYDVNGDIGNSLDMFPGTPINMDPRNGFIPVNFGPGNNLDMLPPRPINMAPNVGMRPITFADSNRLDMYPTRPIDLNRDIYVNTLLANSGVAPNPDAENIYNKNLVEYPYGDRSTYRDLSRDTLVNQMLADQGVPTNPDAEVFQPNSNNFEKYINPR